MKQVKQFTHLTLSKRQKCVSINAELFQCNVIIDMINKLPDNNNVVLRKTNADLMFAVMDDKKRNMLTDFNTIRKGKENYVE